MTLLYKNKHKQTKIYFTCIWRNYANKHLLKKHKILKRRPPRIIQSHYRRKIAEVNFYEQIKIKYRGLRLIHPRYDQSNRLKIRENEAKKLDVHFA